MDRNIGLEAVRLTEAAAMEIEFFDFEDRWIRRTRTIGAACSRSRSDWCGVIGSPKCGKTRRVPMTKRLAEALSAIRHLRGPRALYQHDGDPVTETKLRSWMERAERAVALPVSGHIHRLRHTFCSHVAMNAVPMKAIQVWAGHADLKTTQRYMHLSPEGMDSMISVLERGAGVERKSNRVRK